MSKLVELKNVFALPMDKDILGVSPEHPSTLNGVKATTQSLWS